MNESKIDKKEVLTKTIATKKSMQCLLEGNLKGNATIVVRTDINQKIVGYVTRVKSQKAEMCVVVVVVVV